ncbi:uncharacterized protein LOC144608114 [Rhinoraja longicauda]
MQTRLPYDISLKCVRLLQEGTTDISLLGGGFNVGSHDRPDVQQQRQQQRVRPPRIGLIIGGAGRLSEAAGAAATRRALGLARCGPSGAACNHNNLTAGEDSRRRERHCGLPSQ